MPVRSASWRAVRGGASAEIVSIRARTRRAPSHPCAAFASGGILTAEALAIDPSRGVRIFLSADDNGVGRIPSTKFNGASGAGGGPAEVPARRHEQDDADDQGAERDQHEQ